MTITASTPERIASSCPSSSRGRRPTTSSSPSRPTGERHRGDLADDRREQRHGRHRSAKVFSMDKLVGKDIEKGLARLKANAETATA